MEKITVTGEDLTFEQVIQVACQNAKIELGDMTNVEKSVALIKQKVDAGEVIYGVTTGFGAKADQTISAADAVKLQANLLLSHATGVGKPFPERMVRAALLIRLNTLMKGYSGVKPDTLKRLKSFLNHRIHPVIPEQGSLGASGDLCPLSHLALPLIEEGSVEYKGVEYRSRVFFKSEEFLELKKITGEHEDDKWEKIELSYKEGLALNNGTTIMAALGTFAVYDFERLLKLATLTSSLMMEAFCAREKAFDDRVHQVRKHDEQIEVARWIREFTAGSTFMNISPATLKSRSRTAGLNPTETDELEKKTDLLEKLAQKKVKPQDSYSFRCMPQVFGASLQALNHVRGIFANELNAVVDNPLLFVEEGEVISAGNFHGQPLALALDYLKLAIAEIGNIVERQINKLLDGATNDLLEPFLVYDEKNINSGLMISQYVAASLVSENKVLVHPASADSIPTSANTEDHVSMGATAGRQALEILENVKKVITIAILTAHHAMEIRRRQFKQFDLEPEMAKPTAALFYEVKRIIADFNNDNFLDDDRYLYDDLDAIAKNYDSFAAIAEKFLAIKTR